MKKKDNQKVRKSKIRRLLMEFVNEEERQSKS